MEIIIHRLAESDYRCGTFWTSPKAFHSLDLINKRKYKQYIIIPFYGVHFPSVPDLLGPLCSVPTSIPKWLCGGDRSLLSCSWSVLMETWPLKTVRVNCKVEKGIGLTEGIRAFQSNVVCVTVICAVNLPLIVSQFRLPCHPLVWNGQDTFPWKADGVMRAGPLEERDTVACIIARYMFKISLLEEISNSLCTLPTSTCCPSRSRITGDLGHVNSGKIEEEQFHSYFWDMELHGNRRKCMYSHTAIPFRFSLLTKEPWVMWQWNRRLLPFLL